MSLPLSVGTGSPPMSSPSMISQRQDVTSSDGEADLDEPDDQVTILAPQPRSLTCSRPPCLKRVSDHTSLLQGAHQTLGTSVGSPSIASIFSFAAPRCFSTAPTLKRQVTFAAAPPEAFVTFHPEDYDRTQIECTQGGSDFDLRLPTKCKRYNGESGEEDESETEDEPLETYSIRAPHEGPDSEWICLKGGSVVGSVGGTLVAGVPRPPADPSAVSLPVHGFKSFGGFGQRSGSGLLGGDASLSTDNEERDEESSSDIEGSDNGAAAFEAAILASKSPNVTPRASPRIIPRWARCTGYFEEATVASPKNTFVPSPPARDATPLATPPSVVDHHSPLGSQPPAQNVTTCSPELAQAPRLLREESPMEVDEASQDSVDAGSSRGSERQSRSASPTRRPSLSRPHAFQSSAGTSPPVAINSVSSPDATIRVVSPDSAAVKCDVLSAFATLHCQDSSGESSSSANEHQAAHSSPSPMSSRCSSTDPWSSLSSDDEGVGSPPHGEWSSCTSPDMIPFKSGATSVATATGSISLHLQVSPTHHEPSAFSDFVPQEGLPDHHKPNHHPSFFTVPATDDADISCDSATGAGQQPTLMLPGPQKSVLRSALSLLEAELSSTARGGGSGSGDVTSGSSCLSSGWSSTDEEGIASSSRLGGMPGAVKQRRKSSLSSCIGGESSRGSGEGKRERRSSRSASSRKTSLSADTPEEDASRSDLHSLSVSPDGEGVTPSRKRANSKGSRSGSASSSLRSGHSGRIKLTKAREDEGGIEDEGALGGF